MGDLLELAERCEQALGPDNHINLAIANAIYGDALAPSGTSHNYTASLDAALTLVPETWGWHAGNCGPKSCSYACVTEPREPFTDFTADATTSALALCAAALRARASSQSGNPHV